MNQPAFIAQYPVSAEARRQRYMRAELKLEYDEDQHIKLRGRAYVSVLRTLPADEGGSMSAWVPEPERYPVPMSIEMGTGNLSNHAVLRLGPEYLWELRSLTCDAGERLIETIHGCIRMQVDDKAPSIHSLLALGGPDPQLQDVNPHLTAPAGSQIFLRFQPKEGGEVPPMLKMKLRLGGHIAMLLS